MKRLGISTMLFGQAFLALAADLPPEWRLATQEELELEGYGVSRTDSATHFTVVEADFNGDGIGDTAYCVKSKEVSGEGLIVRISNAQDFEWLVLNVIEWGPKYPAVGLSMGIDLIPPGTLETACGKGYWDCGSDEPERIDLKHPGIAYFKLESGSAAFYWDSSNSNFASVRISD